MSKVRGKRAFAPSGSGSLLGMEERKGKIFCVYKFDDLFED